MFFITNLYLIDTMCVKDRVKVFAEYKKMTISKFEEMCDLSNGYIAAMRKGFGQEKLNNVLTAFPELNREWLLYGEGEMLKVPATLTVYNPSSEERQEIGESVDMSVIPAAVVEEIKAEVVEEMIVPIVPHEVALKAETNIKKYIEDNASELEHFDPRSVTAEVDTAERICTNSMYPTFLPGDVIFIQFLQEKSKITDGGIYYFDTSTRPTMIRLVKLLDDGRLLLKAFNPRYGDIYMRKEEITNIGKISGMYRQTFSDMYAEIEEVRRKKDEQVNILIEQNGEALNIIKNLIKKG